MSTASPILAYHSIDETGSFMSTRQRVFERQMDFLVETGRRGVSLSHWLQAREQDADRKLVALTFDDGYRNNFELALPILRERGFTASVFLVTGYLGRENSWTMARHAPRLPLMSWKQAEAMAAAGIELQGHTHRHADLTGLSRDDLRAEIEKCFARLDQNLGGLKQRLFCYPYGRFNPEVMSVLEKSGCRAAVTTRLGWNRPGTPLLRLERIVSRWFSDREWVFRLLIRGAGSSSLLGAARAYSKLKRLWG